MSGDTPADLLREAVSRDSARPFLTHYDDALGSRVELSYATFDNWVAKTANLLVDEFGADPGDEVALALPAHWQTAVWLFACWSAGLVARPVPDGSAEVPGARVVATDAARLDAALASGAEEVVALSLHPLGAPLEHCPPPAVDYATQVRGHGDQFVTYTRVGPEAPALALEGRGFSGGELAEAARSAAERFGLTSADRIYAQVSMATYDDIVDALLAPMAAGTSVVFGTNDGVDTLDGRFSTERITATVGKLAESAPARRLR
ncbi:MAG TPA: TIGR03089 family protein [Streptosporangiaceae bacterium]|jgi:uncharacterized protein (TIGR03089 family)